MIIHYHRPKKLDEAVKLLSEPQTRPLGGGTVLSRQCDESFSVVDLQALGLGILQKSGSTLKIGATVPLQELMDSPLVSPPIKMVIKIESPLNLRTLQTVAGTLVTCDGRSPFGTIMLALDAKCLLVSENSSSINLGDLFLFRDELLQGKLITRIDIPLNVRIAFEKVARTPFDKPIICVALAQWPSGRTRMVLGGWGKTPSLAVDGRDASGIDIAAINTAHDSTDEWATAEYRSDIAAVLSQRCLADLQGPK